MNIDYIGEQLYWGRLGDFLIVLSFTASLFAALAFFRAFHNNDRSWKQLARKAFYVHAASVVSVMGLIIYLILRQRFEDRKSTRLNSSH